MNFKNIKNLFLLILSALTLVACSETSDDDTSAEFADWQNKNEQAFEDTLAFARTQGEANGWYVYNKWSIDNVSSNGSQTPVVYENSDKIVVHVLETGTGENVTPLYTDSVCVSYCGYLLPSKSYPNGYNFDGNFKGIYDVKTALTSKFLVSGLVDGFTTALMHMGNIGDHWMVYIPYDLAYGSSSSSSSIPNYSMLRFEIVLRGYYRNHKWHY